MYDHFSIWTTESNEFKLHLKESLLIQSDKPELNRNCYTHPLKLFELIIKYIVSFVIYKHDNIIVNYLVFM